MRVHGSHVGLWVQPYPGGPVGLVGTEGLVRAFYSAGLRLAGVTPAGAWCGPHRGRRELVQRPPEPEQVLCLDPDGITRAVTVDRSVGELYVADGGLYGRVRADPTERPESLPPLGKPDPGEVWLHLPAASGLPDRLTRAEHGDATPPARPAPMLPGTPGPGSWHSPEEVPGVRDALAGGWRWAVGWDGERPGQPPVLATGHDPLNGKEHRRVQLGAGQPAALAEWGDSLWIALRRTRRDLPDRHAPVDLMRLDAHTGHIATTLPGDSLDITPHCRPLPPEPPETSSYVGYHRHSFEGLAAYAERLRRALEDGDTTALEGRADRALGHELRSCRVESTGHWPDTTIELHCTHARFPDLELVRVLGLFDELGRQTPPEHAGAHLLEDIDTGQLPPASEASGSQLYI